MKLIQFMPRHKGPITFDPKSQDDIHVTKNYKLIDIEYTLKKNLKFIDWTNKDPPNSVLSCVFPMNNCNVIQLVKARIIVFHPNYHMKLVFHILRVMSRLSDKHQY